MQVSYGIIRSMIRLSKRITTPIDAVVQPEDRRQATLLSASIVLLLGIIVLEYIVVTLLGFYEISFVELISAVLALSFLIPAYFLSRTHRYKQGAALLGTGITLTIWISVIISRDEGMHYLLYYMIFAVVISSTFLSDSISFGASLAIIALTLLVPTLNPVLKLEQLPIVFLTMFSILFVIINRHNHLLERDRHEALSDSEAQYRILFETLSDMVVVHSEGIIIRANDKCYDLLGYQPQEMIGHHVLEFFPSEAHDMIKEKLQKRQAETYESTLITKDQRKLVVEISGRYYSYKAEQHRVAIIRDIEERKQSENQKIDLALERQKNTLMQRFIADASHDLRTPLSVIMTSLHLLKRAKSPEDQDRKIAQLEAQAQRLSSLVNDLLTISRLEKAANSALSFKVCDLSIMAREIYEEQIVFSETRKVQLQLSNAEQELMALIDADELRRALRQLVSNAIHYTPEGGRVTILTYAMGHEIYFEVEDTGIGMSEEDVERIFDPFYRADRARSTNSGGMGLGLAITHNIIKAHGGKITVKSQKGQGSIFRVTLTAVTLAEGFSDVH